jgi:hypothetical protein
MYGNPLAQALAGMSGQTRRHPLSWALNADDEDDDPWTWPAPRPLPRPPIPIPGPLGPGGLRPPGGRQARLGSRLTA